MKDSRGMIKVKVFDEFKKPVMKEWIKIDNNSISDFANKIRRKFL